MKHREAVLDRQYVQERISDAAIALFTASCTLARLDHDLSARSGTEAERTAGRLYLKMANRAFDRALYDLSHNDDIDTTTVADAALKFFSPGR